MGSGDCISQLSSAQFSSVAQSCPTLCDPMNHSTPGLPVHHQLPEFTQTHVHCVVMPSNHLILCPALLLLPLIFPSIRVFTNESALPIRWPKYWSFSFSISPTNEHLGLISFRMDWLDLLAVQGTLKSLLQHHSSKASILLRSAFFTVQLSHLYMTAGKTIALIRWTFISHLSCWHKPQSGWRSWRPEVRDQGVGGLTSPEGCLRVCRQPSSPCDLTCCVSTSSS